MQKFRDALNNSSDNDSILEASSSDSEASIESNKDEAADATDLIEWLIFGNTELHLNASNNATESIATPDLMVNSAFSKAFISEDGLHWENGTEISNPPCDKMPMNAYATCQDQGGLCTSVLHAYRCFICTYTV